MNKERIFWFSLMLIFASVFMFFVLMPFIYGKEFLSATKYCIIGSGFGVFGSTLIFMWESVKEKGKE